MKAKMYYSKTPKNLALEKTAVIILTLKQFHFTIEQWVQKMGTEWQTA